MAGRSQDINDMGADEPGGTRHQNAHDSSESRGHLGTYGARPSVIAL
jgi:hypothetical protein